MPLGNFILVYESTFTNHMLKVTQLAVSLVREYFRHSVRNSKFTLQFAQSTFV